MWSVRLFLHSVWSSESTQAHSHWRRALHLQSMQFLKQNIWLPSTAHVKGTQRGTKCLRKTRHNRRTFCNYSDFLFFKPNPQYQYEKDLDNHQILLSRYWKWARQLELSPKLLLLINWSTPMKRQIHWFQWHFIGWNFDEKGAALTTWKIQNICIF